MTERNLPDFGILTVNQITSSPKDGRVGVFPFSRSTWLLMVKKGIVPKGQRLIGRTVGWTVEQVREIGERLARGEFTDKQIWDRKAVK